MGRLPHLLNFTLVSAAIIVAAYWVLIYLGQRSLLFPRPDVADAPARPKDATQIWLPIPGGRVEAWYLPPAGASPQPAPLLLFTHGNGELIDQWPPEFDEPRSWGVGVLLLEYPGYGRSEGSPSQASITAAMLAAYTWARSQPGIDPSRIIAYGRSLGGGAACVLASQQPVAALVLESSFTSVRPFALRFAAPGFLVRDPFDNLAVLRDFRGPLLVLHGASDEMIPVQHGYQLAAAAPQAEFHRLPCGHNDCPRPWSLIRTFLAKHKLLSTGSDVH